MRLIQHIHEGYLVNMPGSNARILANKIGEIFIIERIVIIEGESKAYEY